MTHQPAFYITRPMQTPRMHPDQTMMQSFTFGPQPGDGFLPTFFPLANRSANSQSDPWSGKPNGIRMLVVPPTRYNMVWRTKRGAHDVRSTLSQPLPSRRGTKGLSVGS